MKPEIPEKEQRDKWRKLAEDTMMISAVGEYTPKEFTILLDAVDVLERELAEAKAVIHETYRAWVGRDYMHLPLPEAVGAVRTIDIALAEKAEAERDQLRAEVERLNGVLAINKADTDHIITSQRTNLVELRARVAELSSHLDTSNDGWAKARSEIDALWHRVAELEQDQARLDWLNRIDEGAFDWFSHPRNIRAAIDAAQKGTQ